MNKHERKRQKKRAARKSTGVQTNKRIQHNNSSNWGYSKSLSLYDLIRDSDKWLK